MSINILMVGFPCSGKQSGQKLDNEVDAIRLTLDEWNVNLFGDDISNAEYSEQHYLMEHQ